MKKVSRFIELPNGESIRSEAIVAIRLGDPQQADEKTFRHEHKPRVIVDYTFGDHGNLVVLDCETIEERDQLAADLKAQV